MQITREQDRLGWLPAGALALSIALVSLVGSVSWAGPANLDQEIQRQEADAAQIASTLGRPTRVAMQTKGTKIVKLEMRRAHAKAHVKVGRHKVRRLALRARVSSVTTKL